jgi:uncharacterized protein YndB with AHSA1/START domain
LFAAHNNFTIIVSWLVQARRGGLALLIELSIEIKAAPETVWYWLGDPERAKRWMTSVGQTEYIERTPDLIGSTFRETVQQDGQSTELTGIIVDYVPNRQMAFHLEGDYNIADVQFSVQTEHEITRVTQTAEVRFKGLLKVTSLVFGRTIKRNIVHQSTQELATLKRLCECSPPGDEAPNNQCLLD